jgi:hypothetical protein
MQYLKYCINALQADIQYLTHEVNMQHYCCPFFALAFVLQMGGNKIA